MVEFVLFIKVSAACRSCLVNSKCLRNTTLVQCLVGCETWSNVSSRILMLTYFVSMPLFDVIDENNYMYMLLDNSTAEMFEVTMFLLDILHLLN